MSKTDCRTQLSSLFQTMTRSTKPRLRVFLMRVSVAKKIAGVLTKRKATWMLNMQPVEN
jgi:hypothetical protein